MLVAAVPPESLNLQTAAEAATGRSPAVVPEERVRFLLDYLDLLLAGASMRLLDSGIWRLSIQEPPTEARGRERWVIKSCAHLGSW